MDIKLQMVFWNVKKRWVGRIVEYPELFTSADTPEALEQALIERYKLQFLAGAPADYQVKEISVPR